ncbi:MAG: hypothetical protein KAI66_21265 [Lentisphaeria bacterium]|nr:hypothetical protein [Lentisphaeria bacterium]
MVDLRFGLSSRVITPTVPVSLAGYFNLRPWEMVLDDLLVRALALRQGGRSAALMQFDLVTVSNEIMEAVRGACGDIEGLAPENILFTASHTHTAPEIRGHRRGGNPEYTASLIEHAIAALHEAFASLKPGRFVTGSTSDDRFAFNRRYWMKDGTVITNPPRRHPDIVRPEGPIDPVIGLVGIETDEGLEVLLANIVNHADTIEGCGVSGDWPGFVARTLEEQNPGLRVIPLNGCEGNINHLDPDGVEKQSSYETARRIGTGYAERIQEVLGALRPSQSQELVMGVESFTTGPREISEEELSEARQIVVTCEYDESRQLTSEDLATGSPAALRYFADRLLIVAEDRADRTFELHALGLGDALLVTLPGEPFVENGLTIRNEMSACDPTLIANLNQDGAVYIPNRFNYGRGGYETTPRCSPYSMETANHMLAGARRLLAGLDRLKKDV